MAHEVLVADPADRDLLRRCFRVFSVLRPHLREEQFLDRVALQARESYVIAYVEHGGAVSAAAGFRIAHFLAWGKVLYVDDLVTDPARKRQGLGGALLDWLIARARTCGCDEVHLDTGFQRHDAHRLYLNKGFVLGCHHMALKLG